MSNQPRQYLGEPDVEYRGRLTEWNKQQANEEEQRASDRNSAQSDNDREVHARGRLLTLQKLRQDNSKPLLAEVVELTSAGLPKALVTHKPRRVAPSTADQAFLPCANFFRECPESDADITLLPDQLNGWRTPKYLKRIKPVEIGMRGRLLWAYDSHPVGSVAPENWLVIVDDSLATMDADQIADSVAQSVSGVVASIRDGGGYAVITVDLDSGGSAAVSMPFDLVPEKGVRGLISYGDDGEAKFSATDVAA